MKKNADHISYIYLCISIFISIFLYFCIYVNNRTISSPTMSPAALPAPLSENKKKESAQIEDQIKSETIASPDPANCITYTGIISKGENLYLALRKNNIHHQTIHFITSKMSPLFNFSKKSRPGDSYTMIQDPNSTLISFQYKVNPLESYILKRNGHNQWDATRQSIKLDKYWERICGKIKGSLFSSFANIDKEEALAAQFANIFAWKIDFHHESRDDDQFDLVVEKLYHGDTFICYGDILAARYDGAYTGTHSAYYFEKKYYSSEGRSLILPFLRAPLNYRYISSGYTYRRLHPILKKVRPHPAIDFAAPSGTPIWAVADGKVISKKYDPYNGKQIILRHNNGYTTYYNHCSSFAKGIYIGAKVKQKQTIAYVGTTGLSTGPHLDYRVKRNGKNVNPLTIKLPKGSRLSETKLPKFTQYVEEMKQVLNGEKDYNDVIVASIDSANL
ncbi:MAG: M23 family metallopeptidase [bacterium]